MHTDSAECTENTEIFFSRFTKLIRIKPFVLNVWLKMFTQVSRRTNAEFYQSSGKTVN